MNPWIRISALAFGLLAATPAYAAEQLIFNGTACNEQIQVENFIELWDGKTDTVKDVIKIIGQQSGKNGVVVCSAARWVTTNAENVGKLRVNLLSGVWQPVKITAIGAIVGGVVFNFTTPVELFTALQVSGPKATSNEM